MVPTDRPKRTGLGRRVRLSLYLGFIINATVAYSLAALAPRMRVWSDAERCNIEMDAMTDLDVSVWKAWGRRRIATRPFPPSTFERGDGGLTSLPGWVRWRAWQSGGRRTVNSTSWGYGWPYITVTGYCDDTGGKPGGTTDGFLFIGKQPFPWHGTLPPELRSVWAVATRVYWPGMLGGTAFWACTVMLMLGVYGVTKERVLRSAGRCVNCGYPVPKVLGVKCPECGTLRQ